KSLRTLVLVLLCHFVRCQKDPLKDFCRKFSHRTAVMNNKIYIDGGYVNWAPLSAESENVTNEWLVYGDFEIDNSGFPQQFVLPSKLPPNVAGGSLWADEINNIFYAFGGYFTSETPKPFETWAFDGNQRTWSNIITQGESMAYAAHGMSAVSPDTGISYYLGGYQDALTTAEWSGPRRYISRMTTFNMVTREYSTLSGPDLSGRGEGSMHFIPASNAGMLIYYGGVEQYPGSNETKGDIWIFDLDLQRWYMQKATGDVPEPRARFCSGVTWADDKSSYNIYLLGGIDPDFQTVGFGDVYVLTLPSFIWIKWWPRPEHNVDATFPHHSLTCDVINGTQMIVMGGHFTNITSECDVPVVYGQHGLDLGVINDKKVPWVLFRYDNPPYRVPELVVNVIGGTARGNANATRPKNNMTYDEYLFEKSYSVPQRYPTVPWQPSTTSIVGTNDTNSGSLPETSTLVGAVIGSIVGSVILGVAGYY
ncbi:hypothetical protein BS50DRAFT_475119, partial [Corynespora cassiicola Philippines]